MSGYSGAQAEAILGGVAHQAVCPLMWADGGGGAPREACEVAAAAALAVARPPA